METAIKISDDNRLKSFKGELKSLLTKYEATIGCDIDGDTHGLSTTMTVDFGKSDKWKNYILCNGSCIDKSDITD